MDERPRDPYDDEEPSDLEIPQRGSGSAGKKQSVSVVFYYDKFCVDENEVLEEDFSQLEYELLLTSAT